jgi:fibronectin-binding autotransporter adhesin
MKSKGFRSNAIIGLLIFLGRLGAVRSRVAFTICAMIFPAAPSFAQLYNVTNGNATGANSLAAAIQAANAWTGPMPFTIDILYTGTIRPAAQMVIGLNPANTAGLVLNGNGNTIINMSQANGGAGDRAFFVAGGNVTLQNLTIAHGRAVGGNGSYGAGGGAGLGGGIFVANNSYITGAPQISTNLVLNDVFFQNNLAAGGAGSEGGGEIEGGAYGGGGGMGGNGGASYGNNGFWGRITGGGGGGGFGFGADGGSGNSGNGAAGALVVTTEGGGGGGESGSGSGGAFGGGGGGGNPGYIEDGGGGGGGARGAGAVGSTGAAGGFGGGGGGGGWTNENGGHGGFGGGGGAGGSSPGSGGFGGGGGAGLGMSSAVGNGGFGGGNGAAYSGTVLGGGGLGAGGGLFAMNGTTVRITSSSSNPLFTNNTVQPGTSGESSGSAIGSNIFLGGNVVFAPQAGTTMPVSGLGGGAFTSDPDNPDASGGITIQGAGTVLLSGTNTNSGATIMTSGTLAVSQSSAINNNSPMILNGGTLQFQGAINGAAQSLSITVPSVFDFGGNMNSSFSFSTLAAAAPLAVWNYVPVIGAMNLLSGNYTGSLSNITFYSDAGQTSLGRAYLSGTILSPNTIIASNGAQLEAAVGFVNALPVASTISIAQNATIQPDSQLFIGLNAANTEGLVIQGNNATIDMSQANGGAGDRAFFVASGNVTLADMTIANGKAIGGNGVNGGGGGAGLGGGIFVGNMTQQQVAGYTQPANVTLMDVDFQNNRAAGGNGVPSQYTSGGGGGMGGNGGTMNSDGSRGAVGGGGGGGFGFGADGGSNSAGLPGAFAGGAPGGDSMATSSPNPGGANGGGGGGNLAELFGPDTDTEAWTSGGGGGVGGKTIRHWYSSNQRADGGFGGGGAGTGIDNYGGNGGFGGGGGAAPYEMSNGAAGFGGNGGFGGGGGLGLEGGQITPGTAGAGGFGAGGGYLIAPDQPTPQPPLGYNVSGGGGLGAGGAIFVMGGASLTVVNGSFNGNTVANGTGFVDGSAYGPDAFLGSNITFQVDAEKTVALGNLGGAGNLSDTNVARHASDPNANGGISKTGQGTLALYGANYYTGATVVNAGTLAFGVGASENGTARVVVGQNPGDNAVLVLGGNSSLMLGGFNATSGSDLPVVIAQGSGSTGSITIGSGAGSGGAFIGARVFQGGNGSASLAFTQDYAAGSGSDPVYPFYTTLVGNLSLSQSGNGTTLLNPLYGPNSFTGAVVADSGTLATTSNNNLGSLSAVAVAAGATLQLGGNETVASLGGAGSVVLAQAGLTISGDIPQMAFSGSISGNGSLAKNGTGNLALGGNITFAGSISVNSGTLQMGPGAILSGNSSLNINGGVFDINGGTATINGGTLNGGQITNSAGGGTMNLEGILATTSGTVSVGLAGGLAGGIRKSGSGTTTLAGNNSASLAGITVSSGTLQIGDGGTSGTLTSDDYLELNGTLAFNRSDTYMVSVGTIFGGGEIVQSGSGTLRLEAFSLGVSALVVEAGSMVVDSQDAEPSILSQPSLEVAAGASFTLKTHTTTFSSLAGGGSITLDGASLVHNNAANATFSGTINGSGGFTQNGTATTMLAGNLTYTGPTQINSGTLLINGSLGASSSVGVAAGATLGGNGTIGGPLAVQGTVSPGVGIESLAVGRVTFDATSTFDFQTDSSAASAVAADLLVVTVGINIVDGAAIAFSDLSQTPAAFAPGTILTLVNYGGDWNGGCFSLNGTSLTQGSQFTTGGTMWAIDYSATTGGLNFQSDQITGRFINMTAVPEPSTYALLALGALVWAVLARRSGNSSRL